MLIANCLPLSEQGIGDQCPGIPDVVALSASTGALGKRGDEGGHVYDADAVDLQALGDEGVGDHEKGGYPGFLADDLSDALAQPIGPASTLIQDVRFRRVGLAFQAVRVGLKRVATGLGLDDEDARGPTEYDVSKGPMRRVNVVHDVKVLAQITEQGPDVLLQFGRLT